MYYTQDLSSHRSKQNLVMYSLVLNAELCGPLTLLEQRTLEVEVQEVVYFSSNAFFLTVFLRKVEQWIGL